MVKLNTFKIIILVINLLTVLRNEWHYIYKFYVNKKTSYNFKTEKTFKIRLAKMSFLQWLAFLFGKVNVSL